MNVPTDALPARAAAPPDHAPSEAELMRLAQVDPALFAPLYERYFERVYAYCLRRAENSAEAEDLCSQVFARALAGLHLYRGGMVSAWLFQIAHNVVASHYRGRRPVVPLEENDHLPGDDVAESVERADEARLLSALVADLPEAHRDLLALTLDAGLTSQEVGLVLGKSAVAVRVQLHRIIKGLRERFLEATEGDAR